MSYQPFAVYRRTPQPQTVACLRLRGLLNEDWAEAIDTAQLSAAIDDLENAALAFEQSRGSFEQKSSRLHDSLNRYDSAVERAMAGNDDLERLFERTGALDAASEEFRGVLSERSDARTAAQKALQAIALLLAAIDVSALDASARGSFDGAMAELDLWMDRLSDGCPPVPFAMLPAARWRRIA